MTFDLSRIDHLGIAVRSIDERAELYRKLGLEPAGREVVEGQKVEVLFLPVGESAIELLEPTADDSPIARFLEKKGEGIHHVCYRVDDIEAALDDLRAQGVPVIEPAPVDGAHGARVGFLHPKATGGVLIELKEPSSPESPAE